MTEARAWADEMTSAINTSLQAMLEDHLEDLEFVPAIMLAEAATAVAEHHFTEAIALIDAYATRNQSDPTTPIHSPKEAAA
ncbi:hypothetical protein [Pseudooceanicola sp.]|uniref:hypothetical protein n=1 Tax=Pseudooceanicola sp. TaxID=1914328 RepID=UPI0035C78227